MSELYSLPDGWEWKKLGKIAKLQNGFAFKSKLFVNDGLPIVRIKNIKNEKVLLDDVVYFNVEDYGKKLDSYQIKKNDILIAMSGATTGKIGLYDTEEISYLNQRVGLFRIENSNLRSYLFYFLSTQIEKNLELSLGAAQPNLSTEQINNIELPLPPLEEQKRIVAKLDILFAKIDKAIDLHQKNIDEADIFIASVLNDVFAELEEKYEKKELSNLVSKLGDGLHGTPKYDDNGEYYFINGANVKDNKIIVNQNTKKVNEDEYNKYKKELNDRTIFVSINGTIGNVGLYNNEKCILGKSACYFNLLENIDKIYITYVLKNGDFQEYIEKNSTGATIKNVSLKTMRAYKIPLPPLPTQQKVVAYLNEISNKMEKIKQIQKEKMQSLKELKASILDKAFKGEL